MEIFVFQILCIFKKKIQHHNCIIIGSDIHPPSDDRVEHLDAFIQLHPHEDEGRITIDALTRGLQNGINNKDQHFDFFSGFPQTFMLQQ